MAVTASVLVLDRHGSAPSSSAGVSSATDAAAASALLARLAAALEQGSATQVASLAAPGDARARRELATLRANVRRLAIRDLTMRYVAADAARLPASRRRPPGRGTWVATVQLGWRLPGLDPHESLQEVPVTLRSSPSGTWFVTARRRHGEAVPLWLLASVRETRTPRAVVLRAASVPSAAARRVAVLADRAVSVVHRVLPRWEGRLVVEVPDDEVQLAAVLGSSRHAYDEIAAVTTTADGSLSSDAPVHIFANPRVLGRLGPRGSQVVMSHEATHVATRAAVSSIPAWLLEGFADYVALAHARIPVRVAASQILARVRRDATPVHLPERAAFDPASKALGASYEAAWLACRLLARTYGERRLVAFYRAVDRTASTTAAFRRLGTDQRAFTRAWQRDLRRLAG